ACRRAALGDFDQRAGVAYGRSDRARESGAAGRFDRGRRRPDARHLRDSQGSVSDEGRKNLQRMMKRRASKPRSNEGHEENRMGRLKSVLRGLNQFHLSDLIFFPTSPPEMFGVPPSGGKSSMNSYRLKAELRTRFHRFRAPRLA